MDFIYSTRIRFCIISISFRILKHFIYQCCIHKTILAILYIMFYLFNKLDNLIYYSCIHNAMIFNILVQTHLIAITFSTGII